MNLDIKKGESQIDKCEDKPTNWLKIWCYSYCFYVWTQCILGFAKKALKKVVRIAKSNNNLLWKLNTEKAKDL